MLFAIHCPGGKVEVGPGVVVVVVVGVVGSGQATIRSKGPKQLNNSMIFWRIFGETQPPECYNQCYIHNRWDVNPKLLEYRFIGLSRIFVGCRTSLQAGIYERRSGIIIEAGWFILGFWNDVCWLSLKDPPNRKQNIWRTAWSLRYWNKVLEMARAQIVYLQIPDVKVQIIRILTRFGRWGCHNFSMYILIKMHVLFLNRYVAVI